MINEIGNEIIIENLKSKKGKQFEKKIDEILEVDKQIFKEDSYERYFIKNLVKLGWDTFLILKVNDKIIGYISVHKYNDKEAKSVNKENSTLKENIYYIASLSILEDYRGKGYASMLLDSVVKILNVPYSKDNIEIKDNKDSKELMNIDRNDNNNNFNNNYKLLLHVRASNEIAIQFYKKRGFEIKREIRKYYEDNENAIEMIKVLI